MKFLVVDDEPLALQDVKESICEVVDDCEIFAFTSAEKAFESYAENEWQIDVAFLDIELGHTTGLVLAKQLKDIQPDIHIIFVTSHEQYAVSAFQMHATGYLMKPINPKDILRELTFIYDDAKRNKKKNIQIQTFGGFGIFVDGKALAFKRQKSKELLACLVDRHGADITTKQACAILWEDMTYDRKARNYFHSISRELRMALREADVEYILLRSHNSLALDITKFDCDSYRFMSGDALAVNAYRNNYLNEYSWAEFMNANLSEEK